MWQAVKDVACELCYLLHGKNMGGTVAEHVCCLGRYCKFMLFDAQLLLLKGLAARYGTDVGVCFVHLGYTLALCTLHTWHHICWCDGCIAFNVHVATMHLLLVPWCTGAANLLLCCWRVWSSDQSR